MAQSAVHKQASPQFVRNLGLATGIIILFCLLHLGAKEARRRLGEEIASKTGKDEFGDCFDFGLGSLTCGVKMGSKVYTNNIRASIVERSKQKAFNAAWQQAISDGLVKSEAARKAQNIAEISAKATSTQARRISGPLFAAIWDGLEVLYYGGSFAEVTMRTTGTLVGTWGGGVAGENRFGRVGYLVGTQVGSWAGSRISLMTYDIVKAIQLIAFEVKDFITGADENKGVGDETKSEEEYNAENSYQSSSYGDPSSDESGSGWFSGSDEDKPSSDEL